MDHKFFDRLLGTRKGELAFLAAAGLLAVAYRCHETVATLLSGVPSITHISYDGVYYAQIAKNILSGNGPGWEAMIFPVLQPLIVSAVSAVTGVDNLAFLAVCVNSVAGVLLLFPVYYIAKDCFGVRPAAAAVLVLIPYPHLVATASGDTAESLYALLTFTSMLVSMRAVSSGSLRLAALAGLSLGATYLARPEGLNIFVIVCAVAAYRLYRTGGTKKAASSVALITAGFMLMALPYAVFLMGRYGHVVLSPKLPYESVVMKAKVFGDPLKMSDVEGLTARGNLAWVEKGGAGLVLKYFTDNPARFAGKYFENLRSELPWTVRNSSHMQGYPLVYPLYFWLPALASFAFMLFTPDGRWRAALIWAPFVNLFVYPVFTDGFWIYHVPYVPAIVMLAAASLDRLSTKLSGRLGHAVPALVVAVAVWTGYASYVNFTSSPEEVDVVNYRQLLSDESIAAGRQARSALGTDGTYMMKWSRLVYYLGGRWVTLPLGKTDRVLQYGVNNGADYIVEEMIGPEVDRGPQFSSDNGLQLAYVFQSKKTPYVVLVWRIMDGRAGSTESGHNG